MGADEHSVFPLSECEAQELKILLCVYADDLALFHVHHEHISNAEKYFQYRDIHRKYRQQKPKKQEAFYESHRMELTHYEAAERYLNAVMNGKTGIPLKAWKAERDKLNGEKKQLTQQYYALKDEVKEVEQICRNVYSILREESGREQPTRKHEHER